MSALEAIEGAVERLPARSRTAGRMLAGFAVILLMLGLAVAVSVYQQRGVEAVRHALDVDGRLARL